MSLVIKSIGTSADAQINSSIGLAADAVNSCLSKTEMQRNHIDYLINVGVFRDQNMVEPSMAAIIQKKVGVNRDFTKNKEEGITFSFDLMNGASGAINAFQAADAYTKAKGKKYCLVVSSDNQPGGQKEEFYNLASTGGAFLLEKVDEEGKGFQDFHFDYTEKFEVGFEGFVDFNIVGTDARNRINIVEHPEYVERLSDFVSNSVKSYVAKKELPIDKTLLITTQQSAAFPAQIAEKAGFGADQVINLEEIGNTHTSSFAFGFEQMLDKELDKKYEHVLFVGGTGGLASAIAWYKL